MTLAKVRDIIDDAGPEIVEERKRMGLPSFSADSQFIIGHQVIQKLSGG